MLRRLKCWLLLGHDWRENLLVLHSRSTTLRFDICLRCGHTRMFVLPRDEDAPHVGLIVVTDRELDGFEPATKVGGSRWP